MLFKTKEEKENEMKLLINRTVTMMQKQINMLQAKRKVLLQKAENARENGMEDILSTTLAALRQVEGQLTQAKRSLADYELAAQIKEISDANAAFLKAMAVMSREMESLTQEKAYGEIEQGFKRSMSCANVQSAHLEKILAMGKQIFSAPVNEPETEKSETENQEQPNEKEEVC